jgi:hypothetical protein
MRRRATSHVVLLLGRGDERWNHTTLQAATGVYHHRLLADPQALDFIAQRGLDRAAVQTYRIGYAARDELVPYLRWRRLPLGPALRLGLLNHTGGSSWRARLLCRWHYAAPSRSSVAHVLPARVVKLARAIGEVRWGSGT